MEIHLERIDDVRWRVPRQGKMLVEGIIYAGPDMIDKVMADNSAQQVANVASLPGIVGKSMAMPDVHWGYGFPIGGVAAFDVNTGVVSPGGVGYDINCGVRLLTLDMEAAWARERVKQLVEALFTTVPTGVGSHRRDIKLSDDDQRIVMAKGSRWALEQGYATQEDLDHTEGGGVLQEANPDRVSSHALVRGRNQLGTLGSGNHFVELQEVVEIFDEAAARVMGLVQGHLAVSIHTGSRGLGYQVCDDFIETMQRASKKYGIELADRQLCCAPISSPEGQAYLEAMAAAANFAFANRQVITYHVRRALDKILGQGQGERTRLVYDVCHNIAKLERHRVDGKERMLCVHRKGATRAFPPGHPELPADYRALGQPVLVPGDMGRYSYVLVGTEGAAETFYSSCHGAGRELSRKAAMKRAQGRKMDVELQKGGVLARAAGRLTLAEEMPEAYKDVSMVVDVVQRGGLCRKVAKLKPFGVIKG